jgi:hypothetical protein
MGVDVHVGAEPNFSSRQIRDWLVWVSRAEIRNRVWILAFSLLNDVSLTGKFF